MAVSATFLLGTAASASAGTLDQQQTSESGFGATLCTCTYSAAETFTAGITGALDEVDLNLKEISTPTAYLSIEIRDVSGGVPGGQILDSLNLPASSVPVNTSYTWVPIHFASPARVAAGTQYAIVAYSLTAGTKEYAWEYAGGNPYAAGTAFETSSIPPNGGWAPFGLGSPVYDFTFKTYVVPASSSTAPTGQRAAALKKCKKRAHKHHWAKKRLRKCKRKANLLPV